MSEELFGAIPKMPVIERSAVAALCDAWGPQSVCEGLIDYLEEKAAWLADNMDIVDAPSAEARRIYIAQCLQHLECEVMPLLRSI